ncbi:MAG: hypothetical protein ACLFQX_11665, partial [Candidatus Kapaibacterium sp.]
MFIPDASYCIPIIATIIGVAYPIVLQVVSRLDDKYSSSVILELFQREKSRKFFYSTIYVTATIAMLWILGIPLVIEIGTHIFILKNAADILLYLTTSTLLLSFFILVFTIIIYFNPKQLINYLISEYDRKHNECLKERYFFALVDILKSSIEENWDQKLIEQNPEFKIVLYKQFKAKMEYREVHKDKENSQKYYATITDIVELIIRSSYEHPFLEYRAINGIWLFGEDGRNSISNETFKCQWQVFLTLIRGNKEELIMGYWETIDNFYRTNYEILDWPGVESVNKDKLLEEKEELIDFNYILGGLILYTGNFNLLKRILNFTSSKPPTYYFLPDNINEVINKFIHFYDNMNQRFRSISTDYPFPGLEGAYAEDKIKIGICKYIAFLYIRVFTLNEYSFEIKPTSDYSLPEKPNEIRKHLDHLPILYNILTEILQQEKEGLKKLDLVKVLDLEWQEKNNRPDPLEKLKEILQKTEVHLTETLKNVPLSEDKIKKFQETAINDFIRYTKHYFNVSYSKDNPNKYADTNKHNIIRIRDYFTVYPKSAFIDNSDRDFGGVKSAIFYALPERLIDLYINMLRNRRKKKYLFKISEIPSVLKKLRINPTDHVLVAINALIENDDPLDCYEKQILDCTEQYEGFTIHKFEYGNHITQNPIIMVMKKEDIPKILYTPPKEDKISLYNFKKSDTSPALLIGINDLEHETVLRKRFNIQQEVILSDDKKVYDHKVLICVDIPYSVVVNYTADQVNIEV